MKMKKPILLFVVVLITVVLSTACGRGVMDDTGGHESNSEKKNSLPSPGLPSNAVTPGSGTSNPYPANVDDTNSGAASNDFMTQAAESGTAEVELSRIAQSNAQNPAVKNFDQMMIADHSKANDELRSLASKKGVTIPTALNAEHQSAMQRLQGLKGSEFDAEYIKIMVQDHEKAVGLFQAQAQNGNDADAKSWAAQTLPKLQEHLQKARELQSKKP
jgi:putative membrane protein